MKKSQVILGMPIISILLLALFFLIAILGFSVINNIKDKYELLEIKNFINSLDNAITKHSKVSFGSVNEVSLLAPSQIEGLCFIDKDAPFNSLVNIELNQYKNIFDEENVFSIPFNKGLNYKIDGFELDNDQNPLCISAVDKKINIRLQNIGNKTLLKQIDDKDVKIDCITVFFNDDSSNNLDLVFIPYGYKNSDGFKNDVEELTNNVILNFEPLKSKKDIINVFMVDTVDELQCQVSPYISCDNHQTNIIAAKCPHDYIFVLVERNKLKNIVLPARSSAVSNIARINTADKKNVVMHEFGHIFGGLADEYVDDKSYNAYNFNIDQYPNCDNKECRKWSKIQNTSCFKGCSLSSSYRSSKDSIMRSLDINFFGTLNEIVLSQNLFKYENDK